jgi:hypothetical protein
MASNQEILTKAIQKAIDDGWDMFGFRIDEYIPPWYIVQGGQMPTPKVVEKWVPKDSLLICDYADHYFVWEHVLFNHDFAKALFKDDGWCLRCDKNMASSEHKDWCPDSYDIAPIWQYHLQQMVIAEDPIKYLGEHLND